MIMIAGLMKREVREDTSGITILSKIPILGTLFGSRTNLIKKTELIVFLRPTIITGDSALPGMEPGKLISPKLMSKEMRRLIIAQEVKKITVTPLEWSEGSMEGIENEFRFKKEESEESDLEGKLKGFKEL